MVDLEEIKKLEKRVNELDAEYRMRMKRIKEAIRRKEKRHKMRIKLLKDKIRLLKFKLKKKEVMEKWGLK